MVNVSFAKLHCARSLGVMQWSCSGIAGDKTHDAHCNACFVEVPKVPVTVPVRFLKISENDRKWQNFLKFWHWLTLTSIHDDPWRLTRFARNFLACSVWSKSKLCVEHCHYKNLIMECQRSCRSWSGILHVTQLITNRNGVAVGRECHILMYCEPHCVYCHLLHRCYKISRSSTLFQKTYIKGR